MSHFTALYYQAWLSPSQNLNRSAFRLFGICVFFCGIIAEMFFFGSFHRFSRRLQIAHLNPQTLRKNTLDIQVFFETKSFRTLRCLMSRCIGFREKAGQHREHPRTPGFFLAFQDLESPGIFYWLIDSLPNHYLHPYAGEDFAETPQDRVEEQLQMSPTARDTVQSRFEEKPRKDMYWLVVEPPL